MPDARTATIECLLIADDLTGACDSGVHFAMRGLGPVVVRLPGHTQPASARVLACTTESRDCKPEQIRNCLQAVAAEFARAPVARVFKKIDSTLRGNAGMEIVAARDAFHCDAAVVCPAFPAMHRVVETGILRITNAPHFTPIDMATRLRQQASEPCTHTSPRGIAQLLAAGNRLISVDAASDADLDQIAAALIPLGRRVLWAGSAGLAAALSRGLTKTIQPRHPVPELSTAPALFCLGSNHRVTLEQQAALIANRSAVLCDAPAICKTLAAGRHAIHRILRGQIPEALTTLAPAALILSGGDTASLVCRAIDAHAIELHDEIVPGVPRGILRGGPFDGLPVVTKSGGFGDRDTLIQVADFFHAPN